MAKHEGVFLHFSHKFIDKRIYFSKKS